MTIVKIRIILIVSFLLLMQNSNGQSISLLSDRKMDVDFSLMLKMSNSRHDDFRFVSGSLNVIPVVAIYPVGEADWGSEVYDYNHESRVLLYNSRGETRFWTIKKPREDPNIEWFEKDGFYTERYSLYETYIEDKLQSMISFIGADKRSYFVCFFPSEIRTKLPVIGYVENGKDVFVDSRLRTYNLRTLLISRYGSVDRYRELYDIYKKLMSYDPDRIPDESYARLISHMDAAREIATCVEKYKFKSIFGKNVQDTIFQRSGKNTLIVTSYDEKYIIYRDMDRNEQRLGNLEAMKDCYFYARDYEDIYHKGNCDE